MKVGDLVRHKIGSLDRKGIVTEWNDHGDVWVVFFDGSKPTWCRWRNIEVLSESR